MVTIMEFKEGKVAPQTHYYADPFEPHEGWHEIRTARVADNSNSS
jgi:hypothetical protein